MGQKVWSNFERSCAIASREIIIEYFNYLRETLQHVSAFNISSYDETHLPDDVDKQKKIVGANLYFHCTESALNNGKKMIYLPKNST